MKREQIISKYINAVEKILVAFHFNWEPKKEDIETVALKTKEFTNALRELYLSNDKNKDDKYKVVFDAINKARFHICKENFETNPSGTWAVIIHNLEIADSHISELYFKETDNFYPFPKVDLPPKQAETKTEQETIEINPVLKPEAVQIVFEILKDFFSTEQQNELQQLLETGKKENNEHLIFLDNGNRLADAFKQLKKADVITRCEQKELEYWIWRNFNYRYRQKIKKFTLRYLNDIISTNKDKCQKPLLNVKTERATGEIKITKA